VATRDSLKVWSWEPNDAKATDRIGTCLDSVDVRWSNISDMAVVPGREELVSVSTINGVVQTYKVCLLEVATDKMQMKEVERRRADQRARNKKPRKTFAPSSDRSRPRVPWNSVTTPTSLSLSRGSTPESKLHNVSSPEKSQGEMDEEAMTDSLILQAQQLRMKKKESRRSAELQAQRESRDPNSVSK